MILVCDVGNTETTVGVYEGDALRAHWRLTTDVPRTQDEFGLLLRQLLIDEGINPTHVDGAAIASVVPRVTAPLVVACKAWLKDKPVLQIDGRSNLPIKLDVEEPLTVGADRIVNTLAVLKLFGRDAIVVDLGTATTFDCITAAGVFIGGVIAPGVLMQAEALSRRTAKLPATELVIPKHVIGRRTEDNIRSGVMFGAAEAIDGIVRRIKAEWPGKNAPFVVATGGLAETFEPLCREFNEVDPYLTLRGLQLAFDLLSK
ncbi:MAG TPA: type III pantothenate kinase [Gemmatimonadaceae bacterium]|nr:type III pantothenate kinase [Gemmatimonadaceae bacterium]